LIKARKNLVQLRTSDKKMIWAACYVDLVKEEKKLSQVCNGIILFLLYNLA
jgi:hypothetical protein